MIKYFSRSALLFILFGMLATLLPACAAGFGPYRRADSTRRNTARAISLTSDAAELIFTEPDKAENLLREALTADLYHGPAHNNLGVLYLNAGQLYEAASEFEWARKLMPGHPDPRLNLAMTFEEAGRFDEAMDAYDAALDVYPDHLPTLMGMTRMQVKLGLTDERIDRNLRTIVMRAPDPAWKFWAERELIRLDE